VRIEKVHGFSNKLQGAPDSLCLRFSTLTGHPSLRLTRL
jgi:hypothetical protein